MIKLFFKEISEEKSRNQTLEQELMEAKITIQELRKHQLQPQESYYQNHSNQYESDSISGRSTPEPKPIIGKFPNLRVESLAHLVLETIIHCIN